MNRMALKRPSPFIGESRPGYIQRFAKESSVSPIGLLNEAKSCKNEFDQSSSHLIILQDVTYNYFANILDEKHHDTLKTMTFQPIFEKFIGYNLDTVSASTRFWAGVISKKMRFCPQCLIEDKFHKLEWQIKELTVCEKHSIKLLDYCPKCSMQIPLLCRNSQIGYCPYCGAKLQKTIQATDDELIKSNLALDYWKQIREADRINPVILGYGVPESIAAGILYLKTDGTYRNKLLTKSDEHILEKLRGQGKNKIVHIHRVKDVLQDFNLSVNDFSNLTIPPEFIESLLRPQKSPKMLQAKTNSQLSLKEMEAIVLKIVNEWTANNEKVTVGRICEELGIYDIKLKKLGLTPIVAAAAERQRNIQKTITEEEIRKRFETLLNSFDGQVKWRVLFERLGYYRSQIRERYSELYKYIKQQVNNHNAVVRQMDVSELIAVTSEILEDRNLQDRFTSIEDLAIEIDIHPKTLAAKYPEVVEFLKNNRVMK